MKWKYIFNIDTIMAVCLIVAMTYCIFFTRKPRKKYDFKGIGDTGWKISEGDNFFTNFSPPGKKSRTKKSRKKLYKNEERCRQIFESIYSKEFKSVRPNWLKNPVSGGRNLELDGYCDSIRTPIGTGLAFEYDGIQHAKYKKHFHKSGPQEFIYQTKKDKWKDLKCKEKGVFLVRIPHFIAFEDLERYITNKLDKLHLLPKNYKEKRYRTMSSFTPRSQQDEYDEYRGKKTERNVLRDLYK